MTSNTTTELLTVPEVAAILRVDETTVRRHIRTGAIPASKPCGVLRVARADLDTYLESCAIQAAQPRPLAPAPTAPRTASSRSRPSTGSVRDRLRTDRKRAA